MVNQEILQGIKFALERGSSLKDAMMSFYNSGYKKEEIEEAVKELYRLDPQNPAFKQQNSNQESSQIPKTPKSQIQKNTENLTQQVLHKNMPLKQESSSSQANIPKEPSQINSYPEKQTESIFPHRNPNSIIKGPENLNLLKNKEQNIKPFQAQTSLQQTPNLKSFETQEPSQKSSENFQMQNSTTPLAKTTLQTNTPNNPALEIPEQEKEIQIPPLPPLSPIPSMQNNSKKTETEQKQNAQEKQKIENKTIQKVSNYSESELENKSKNQILILSSILAILVGIFVLVLIFRDRITDWILSLFS